MGRFSFTARATLLQKEQEGSRHAARAAAEILRRLDGIFMTNVLLELRNYGRKIQCLAYWKGRLLTCKQEVFRSGIW